MTKMGKTKIDWCDRVWNPTTGCTKISQGCKNCYAERIANRFWRDRKFTDVRFHHERLEDPIHWRKPQRVFVDSMSDLFHPDVPNEFILEVLNQIMVTGRHTYIILTKRPKRMTALFHLLFEKPLHNIWPGVSVEDQATADERIPLLLQTPAAKRIVSYEPALEEVDFWRFGDQEMGFATEFDHRGTYPFYQILGWPNKSIEVTPGIDWLIMGCESGPGARPMDLDWARSVRDQCQAAGVPFFFKQAVINGKLIHMPILDGQMWDQFPE
jgi:protein gp37